MAVKDNYYFSIYNHGLEDILLANLAVLYWESAKHLTTVKLDVAFLLAIFEGGGRFVDINCYRCDKMLKISNGLWNCLIGIHLAD